MALTLMQKTETAGLQADLAEYQAARISRNELKRRISERMRELFGDKEHAAKHVRMVMLMKNDKNVCEFPSGDIYERDHKGTFHRVRQSEIPRDVRDGDAP